MRHTTRVICLGALLTTTSISPAHAEPMGDISSLDAVTVYATRSAQSTFDVPAMVSKVDTDAPANALAGDVGDLLEFTPGVEVDGGPRRNGQQVSIRGFDSEAVITLVDGRRQNFEAAHDGRFFIDTSLLKSVEVVKGAASAIYGGGAVGGVVAFETKDAADLLAPGETMGALTSFGYRSANNEYSPTITGFGRADGWDLLGSVSYRDSGDIEQGNGASLDAEDNVLSGLFKAGYTFSDFHTLKFQAQTLSNDSQEPNNGAAAITASNPTVDKDVQDNQFSLKYEYENPDNQWLSPKVHLYYNDTEVEEIDLTGVNAGRVQSRELNTLGLTIDNQSKLSVSDTHSHTISYGFEIYNDEQTGTSTAAMVRAGVPDAEATNYGFYLQDEMALSTAMGDFLIIPAARFDHYDSEDNVGNSQEESQISPKLSMSYKPTENAVLFGSWAQAFRAPNLTEIYPAGQHFTGVPGPFGFPANNFVANPNLKPETVTTIELGAGLDFDQLLASGDRAKIKGAWFTSDGENFITQVINIGAGTTQNFNIPNATLTGWEVEGQYQLQPVTVKLGLSYVEAENDDTGEYLSNNVPLTFVADIAYQLESVDSVLGWRSRFARANDKVGATDTATAGYGVHDLYYRWTPDDKGLESLTLDVGIDNVFDQAYTRRFASLLEEGRSYGFRVAYKW